MQDSKYAFSSPFIDWFAPMMAERDRINAAKAAGTYVAPILKPMHHGTKMATDKQVAYLKRLGFKGDTSKLTIGEAGAKIDSFVGSGKGKRW